MTKLFAALAAALAAASISGTAQAAPAKTVHAKVAPGKMVSLFQADRCHMYFTAAQAKQFKYACPDSMGKMKLVKVSSAVAKVELAKTNAALAPKKVM